MDQKIETSQKREYVTSALTLPETLVVRANRLIMSLTERERIILHLETMGLSDYKIARKMKSTPPSITRSKQNAHRKLKNAQIDMQYAQKIGLTIN
jgi:DNA-binding NarL/FixJ family response regulator